MRVAILHDHLRFIGGGERVALILADALDADLYVTDLDPNLPERAGLPEARVTEIAKVPRTPILRQTKQQVAFERAELPGYDAYVLSGNWAVFGAKRHQPNLWYCYTPVRAFYDLREPLLRDLSWWRRVAARGWIDSTRAEYEAAVSQVERIVTLSRNVADRVEKYLGRSASIVYPPVDIARYRFDRIGDFWLSVNRLSHEKRIGLQVETFRRLPQERLVVVGSAQVGVDASKFIRSLNPPDNVSFLGEIREKQLLELYATCKGVVATSLDEDFGLTPVEAMASGKAVIAVDEGGYRESVVHGETGWLVPATPDAIARTICEAMPEILRGLRDVCRARAKAFDVSVFIERMRELVAAAADRTPRASRGDTVSRTGAASRGVSGGRAVEAGAESEHERPARDRLGRFFGPIRTFPSVQRLEDFVSGKFVNRPLEAARSVAKPPSPLNAALKSVREVRDAERVLKALRLRAFYDHPFKVWDGARFLTLILHSSSPDASILDLGSGRHSNVLRWLELHGYRDLMAVDLVFRRPVRRGAIRYFGDDVRRTRFDDGRFDCAFAQSVIEHGIDAKMFLREARRLLRPRGSLMVSTDFWPEKIDTSGLRMYGAPWTIFSGEELRAFVGEADAIGFRLLEPLDLAVADPVIEVLGRRYTFVFLAFRLT